MRKTVNQRHHGTSTDPRAHLGFLLSVLYGVQEGQGDSDPACTSGSSTTSLYTRSSKWNHTIHPPSDQRRGLFVISRPTRCLFLLYNLSIPQEISTVCDWQSTVSVQGPPILDFHSTKSFYEDNGGGCGLFEDTRGDGVSVYRRLAYSGTVRTGFTDHSLGLQVHTAKSNFHPFCHFQFIGAILDTSNCRAFLPPDRTETLCSTALRLSQSMDVTVRAVQGLVGLVAVIVAVLVFTRLKMRPFEPHRAHNWVTNPQWSWADCFKYVVLFVYQCITKRINWIVSLCGPQSHCCLLEDPAYSPSICLVPENLGLLSTGQDFSIYFTVWQPANTGHLARKMASPACYSFIPEDWLFVVCQSHPLWSPVILLRAWKPRVVSSMICTDTALHHCITLIGCMYLFIYLILYVCCWN